MKIYLLKRKAKRLYRAYMTAGNDLSCGIALASYIRPEIEQCRRDFNKTMDELAKIDPNTPKQRL